MSRAGQPANIGGYRQIHQDAKPRMTLAAVRTTGNFRWNALGIEEIRMGWRTRKFLPGLIGASGQPAASPTSFARNNLSSPHSQRKMHRCREPQGLTLPGSALGRPPSPTRRSRARLNLRPAPKDFFEPLRTNGLHRLSRYQLNGSQWN